MIPSSTIVIVVARCLVTFISSILAILSFIVDQCALSESMTPIDRAYSIKVLFVDIIPVAYATVTTVTTSPITTVIPVIAIVTSATIFVFVTRAITVGMFLSSITF